jgi:hypothetical protein
MSLFCARRKAAMACVVVGFLGGCGSSASNTGTGSNDASMTGSKSGNDAASLPTGDDATFDATSGDDGNALGDDGNALEDDSSALDAGAPVDGETDGGDAAENSSDDGGDAAAAIADGGDAAAPGSDAAPPTVDSGLTADGGGTGDAGNEADSGTDAGAPDGGSVGTVPCNGGTCIVNTDVCCYEGAGTQSCVAAAQCQGAAVACRGPANCTGGDVCCLSLAGASAGAACTPAASCAGLPLCATVTDCGANEACVRGVCVRTTTPGFDGGFPTFDGGFPGFDGGFPGFP